MPDDYPKFPGQEELEKELSDYLSKKYGYRIKVISPMMSQSQVKESKEPPKAPTGVERIHFDMKPEEMESYLDEFVIEQNDAKAILATKICTHYNRIRYQRRRLRSGTQAMVGRIKNNILLIGPTGVGKTYLVKLIAQKLGVPFVKGDATKFSETGYVGGDVEDLVRELVAEAGDDIELAEHGIIYVDEVDKIASSSHIIGPDVSRTGVQRTLLKPMEETEVDLKVPHDPVSQLQAIEQYRKTGKRERRTVNTRNILFIMSGAFNGLSEIVKKRLQTQGIGFGAPIHSREDSARYLRDVKPEDFIAYGFESEFVGRVPVVAVLEPLNKDHLYRILCNPNNPIVVGKKEDFRTYGIDLKFEDEAFRLMAEQAAEEKTGARALVSVIERVLLPFEKRLPSTHIRFLVVTADTVRDPEGDMRRLVADSDDPGRLEAYRLIVGEEKKLIREQVLGRKRHYLDNYSQIFTAGRIDLMLDVHLKLGGVLDNLFDEVILLYNQIRVFENDFYDEHGFRIQFDDNAVTAIMEAAFERDTTATAICQEISRDFDYGFRLIADRSGKMEFVLPKEVVEDPDLYMDTLIRESFRQYPVSSSQRQT